MPHALLRLPIYAMLTMLCLVTPIRAQTVDFWVTPEGNDSWSGRLRQPSDQRTDGPFATIARAQRAVCELRRVQAQRQGPIQVGIYGTHRLSEPVTLRPEDSGTAQCPTVYCGLAGQEAVLSGGRVIAGWKKGPGDLWTAEIPEVKAGKWYFRQLFVDGRRAQRARFPNEGYLHVEGLVDVPAKAKWNTGVDKFRFKPGDIRPWADLRDAEVVVFHSWNTSRVRIAAVDPQQHIVTFTGQTAFRPLGWDPQQRYYVENARGLLDQPGEWYLERATGTLFYWPLPGQDMAKVQAIAPVLTELVRFEGNPDQGRFVDHVTLTGLSLQHADWSLPDHGYGDGQAAATVPAVVSARGARHCKLTRCEIAHVGNYGIWLSRGCKNNEIAMNHLHDLGAGGVRIGECQLPPSDATESSHNRVTNNYLHDAGLVYSGAVGVWVAQSSHNEISHNEIHSLDYSGISTGWNWDRTPNRTCHNRIEFNHIHHCMRGVLSDGGGVYTIGAQPGTVIRGNLIHDVFPYMGPPAMAWGIYLDGPSTGILVEDNVVYNTLTGGLLTTGENNIVRNNIFALSAWQAAWRYGDHLDPRVVVERNIFYLTQGEFFLCDDRSDLRTRYDYNLYWRTDGEPLLIYNDDLPAWQAKGKDVHSLVANPRFADPARGDFRLPPDSPALKLGFRPIDTSRCGLEGPADWVSLPKRVAFAPTVLPRPKSSVQPIDEDFEQTPVGSPSPAPATTSKENRGGSICVTGETATSGRQSLKFTDAPGMKNVFDPHLYYTPRFCKGTAHLAFDVRVEPGAIVGHEWRDAAEPYHIGPSLLVDAQGRLAAAGKPLCQLPHGKWIHFEFTCALGSQAHGKYDLSVTLPGQSPQKFSLPCDSAKFSRLEWLGFMALANEKAVFYLDNVRLKQE